MEPLEQRQLLAVTFQATPYQEDATTKHLQVNYHLDAVTAPFEIALIAVDEEEEEEEYTVLAQTATDLSAGSHSFTFSLPLSGTIASDRALRVALDPAGVNSRVSFVGGFRDSAGRIYVFGDDDADTITASETTASLSVAVAANTYNYSRTDAVGVSHLSIWGLDGDDQILQSTTALSTPLTLYGGKGDDTLYASNGNATIDGGEGDDHVYGGNSSSSTYTLQGGKDSDTLTGGLGTNAFEPGSGSNLVYAGPGSNSVAGNDGSITVFGGDAAGNITVTGSSTTTLALNFTDNVAHALDFVSGNQLQVGAKTFAYGGTTWINVSLGPAADSVTLHSLNSVPQIVLSNASGPGDTLTVAAPPGPNSLTLTSNALTTPSGSLSFTGIGQFNFTGGNYNDILTLVEPAAGSLPNVNFDGGDGTNTLVINKSAKTTNQSVTIGSSTVQLGASSAVYANVAALSVQTGSGNDTFTVTHSASLPAINLTASSGSSDSLTIISSAATPETVGIDSSKVVYAGKTISYSGLERLSATSGSGADTFTVTHSSSLPTLTLGGGSSVNDVFTINALGSSAQTVSIDSAKAVVTGRTMNYSSIENVTINTGTNNDTFTVTHPTDGTLPKLNLQAGNGSADRLTFNGLASTNALSINIDNAKVTMGGSTVSYSLIEQISVIGGTSVDTLTVTVPAIGALPTLTLDGSGDGVFFGAILNIDATAPTITQTVVVDEAKVTVNGATINYGGSSSMGLISISTGAAADSFTVNRVSSGSLPPFVGPSDALPILVFDGGTVAANSLNVQSTAPPYNHSVAIDGSSISIHQTNVQYANFNSLSVSTGGYHDSYTVTQTAAGPALPANITLAADGGIDSLAIVDSTAAGQAVSIEAAKAMLGTSAINYSNLETLRVTSPSQTIGVTRATGMALPAAIAIVAGHTAPRLTITTGTENDNIVADGANVQMSRAGTLESVIDVTSAPYTLRIVTDGGDDTVDLTLRLQIGSFGASNSTPTDGGAGANDTLILRDPLDRLRQNNIVPSGGSPTLTLAGRYFGFEHVQIDTANAAEIPLGTIVGANLTLTGSTLVGLPYDVTFLNVGAIRPEPQSSNLFVYNAQAPGASVNIGSVNITSAATVAIKGTSGDDVFEIDGDTVRVNGGPRLSISGTPFILLLGEAGNDTYYVRALPTITVNFSDSSGENDTVSFAGIDLAGVTLPSMTGMETLDLSYANLSSVPVFPASITTLDLRYNTLDLSDTTELNPIAGHTNLVSLLLHGNQTSTGVPDLLGLKGMGLRVDLAPVGLEQAENTADLNTALNGIVKALHYLPLALYDYVLNTYSYQHYMGLVKGSLGTLRTKAGNDFDLSQLLVDLLAKVNVSSQIVGSFWNNASTTASGGMAVPVADLPRWMGVQDLNSAITLANRAGPNTQGAQQVLPYSNGSTVTDYVVSHAWVSASLPGIGSILLDASYKLPTLSSNAQQFLDQYNAAHVTTYRSIGELYLAQNPNRSFALDNLTTYNPFTANPFYAIDPHSNNADNKRVAHEWFEDEVAKWVALNAPGLTMADLKSDSVLAPRFTMATALPAVGSGRFYLGNGAIGTVSQLATTTLPGTLANLTKYVKVTLSADGTTAPAQYFAIPDISQDSLTVQWPSPNQLRLFKGETPVGNLITVSTGMGYSVEFGFTSFAFNAGSPPQSMMSYTSTPVIQSKEYSRNFGTVMAIGIEANQISDRLIAAQQAVVNEDALSVLQTGNPTLTFTSAHVAHLLTLAINRFFLRTNEGQKTLDGIFHTVEVRSDVAGGTASGSRALTAANLHEDLQMPIVPSDLFVDVQQFAARGISIEGVASTETERRHAAGASSSSQESAIWEEMMNMGAMSTVKSVQAARSQGATIESITPGEWPTKQALFNSTAFSSIAAVRSMVVASISGAFASGATRVIAPTKETPVGDWHGLGYYAEFPGSLGWIIVGDNGLQGSGGASGNAVGAVLNPDPFQHSVFGGDPVNVSNGAVVDDVTDITIPLLGIPLVFARHYDSKLEGDPTLGKGWYGTYSDKLAFIAGGAVEWIDNHGRTVRFNPPASGNIYTLATVNLVTGVQFRRLSSDGANGYELRSVDGTVRRFNAAGLLDQLYDQNNNTLTINRDGSNRVSTVVTNATGGTAPQLTFSYNGSGKLTQIQSNDGRVWKYTVTGNLLTEVESPTINPAAANPQSSVVTYNYHTTLNNTPIYQLLKDITTAKRTYSGLSFTDSAPLTTTHTYYANGRGFQTINPDGSVQTFHYNSYRGRTTFNDERGNNTIYDFDELGHQTRITYPDRTALKEIWENNLRTVTTDAYGVSTRYKYDVWGNVTEAARTAKDPATLPTTWADADLLQLNDLSSSGNNQFVPDRTTYFYSTALGGGVVLDFSKLGLVTLPSFVANKRKTTFDYGPTGNLLQVRQTLYALGSTSTLTTVNEYGSRGELTKTIDARANGSTTTYTTNYSLYNQFGKPEQITRWIADDTLHGPASSTEVYDYDAFGNMSSSRDGNLKTTTYLYDRLNRLVAMTQPAVEGGVPETIFTYDERGNLLTERDSLNRVTTHMYDSRSRRIATRRADGSLITMVYDALGNHVAASDGLGNVTTSVYDANSRAVQVTTANGASSSVRYNGTGASVVLIDPNKNITRNVYNVLGQVAERLEPQPEVGEAGRRYAFKYDAVGNQVESTEVIETSPGVFSNRTAKFVYDTLNRLVRKTEPDPGSSQKTPRWLYTYDAVGNLLTSRLESTDGTFTAQVTANQYDGLNRLIHQQKADNTQWDYTYDAVGNLKIATDGRGIQTLHNYDALIRLTDKTVNTNFVSATWQDSPKSVYHYDKVGNLTSFTVEQSGSTPKWKTEYAYDELNRRTSETHYDSDLTTVLATSITEYDAAGNVELAIDARGSYSRFQYDRVNRLTKTIDALGAVSTTVYDPAGNVVTTIDPLGRATQHTYDGANRRITTVHPDPDGAAALQSPVETFDYDNQTGDLEVSYFGTVGNPLQRQTDFDYDKLHRRIKTTDPDDPNDSMGRRFSEWRYDVAGNIISNTSITGLLTTYTFDGLNRMKTRIEADPDGANLGEGRTTSFDYDENGNLTRETLKSASNVTVSKTEYGYDRANRETTITRRTVNAVPDFAIDSVYSSTTTRYDAAGNPREYLDELNNITTYAYDGLNRLLSESNYAGSTATGNPLLRMTYTYDASGNLLTSTNDFAATGGGYTVADNRVSRYRYDGLGRQTRATDPLYHGTTSVYNAVGNVTSTIDVLGNTTTFTYDNLNRRTQVTDSELRTTVTAYNETGAVTEVTDPAGLKTKYILNPLNQVINEQQLNGSTVLYTRTYAYDGGGNRVKETQRDTARVREFIFDDYGRMTKETWKQSGSTVETIDYLFEVDDQLASVTDGESTYTYNYAGDAIRRLASVTKTAIVDPNTTTPTTATTTQTYTYSKRDEIVKEAVGGLSFAPTISRTYDALGRETSTGQGTLGAIGAQYTWNPAGQLTQVRRYDEFSLSIGAGTQPTAPVVVSNYTYDAGGRLVGLVHDPASAPAQSLAYTFDAIDRIVRQTSEITLLSFQPPSHTLDTYQHDTTDQLKAASHSSVGPNEAYAYNANGNRTGGGRLYDPHNRLKEDATFTYTYSNEGNLTSKVRKSSAVADDKTTTYTWDHRNRLTSVTQTRNDPGNPQTIVITYKYDAFDRRILENTEINGTPVAGGALAYTYSDDKLLFTRNGQAQLSDLMLNGPAGLTLSQDHFFDSVSQTGLFEVSWLLQDHQNSVRYVVDASAPDVVIHYDAFGNIVGDTTPSEAYSLLGYAGQVHDSETGLIYMNARYYDPATGRFLSEDPIGFAGGDANLYRYVGNNPVNMTDPTGLQAVAKTLGGIPGLGAASAFVAGTSRQFKENNPYSPYAKSAAPISPFAQQGSSQARSPSSSANYLVDPYAPSDLSGAGLIGDAIGSLFSWIGDNHERRESEYQARIVQRQMLEARAAGAYGRSTMTPMDVEFMFLPQESTMERIENQVLVNATGLSREEGGVLVQRGLIAATGYDNDNYSDAYLRTSLFQPYAQVIVGAMSNPLTYAPLLVKAPLLGQSLRRVDDFAPSRNATEGIYEFASSSGRTYVGQTGNFSTRINQHLGSGKLLQADFPTVRTTEVLGGKTVREIAEQIRINELGGVRNLENVRNPIGPNRQHLLPPTQRRS